MRNINEHNITEAVIQRFDGCSNPRVRELLTAVVRHVHDCIREVHLSEAEWEEAIRFLTATGQACSGQRQEFILLSDVLGVSMLTVALNHARPPGATEATVFGPFHTEDAPRVPSGADIAAGAPGEPLWAHVEVVDLQGQPVADAEVDVWEADADGLYDVQRAELGSQRRARGVLRTDEQGRLHFRAVVPTPYPVPTDGPVGSLLNAAGRHPWRPAHLHFRIRAQGFATLVTHLFREPDPYLDSDVVFGVRSSLIGRYERHEAGVVEPDGRPASQPFYTLKHRFVLAPA